MEIELVSHCDLKQIRELEKNSELKRKPYSLSFLEQNYYNNREEFLVAKDNGRVGGYLFGKLQEGEEDSGKKGKIVSMLVHKNFRGQGIGTKLMNELIRIFKEEGANEIFLHVRESNSGAISLYKKLNFKIEKEIENYYSDREDAYLMKKEIDKPGRNHSDKI